MVMRIHYIVVPAGQQELALPTTARLLSDVNVQDAAGLLTLLQDEHVMTEGSTAWVKTPTSLGPRWMKLKHSSALPATEDLEVVIELGVVAAGAEAGTGLSTTAEARIMAKIDGLMTEVIDRMEHIADSIGILNQLYISDWESETETRASVNVPFKSKLQEHYGIFETSERQLMCMITHKWMPREAVSAGHVLAYARRKQGKLLLNLDDVMEPGNGVLWCLPLEQAWTDHQFAFSYVGGRYVVYVFDTRLYNTRLQDYKPAHSRKEKEGIKLSHGTKLALGDLTFGHLHLQKAIESVNGTMPLRRVLSFMGRLYARFADQIPQQHRCRDPLNQEFFSDPGSFDRVKAWLQQGMGPREGAAGQEEGVAGQEEGAAGQERQWEEEVYELDDAEGPWPPKVHDTTRHLVAVGWRAGRAESSRRAARGSRPCAPPGRRSPK